MQESELTETVPSSTYGEGKELAKSFRGWQDVPQQHFSARQGACYASHSKAEKPSLLSSRCLYYFKLLKRSSLPVTVSVPSRVAVCTVQFHHPRHHQCGPQRHGTTEAWTAHLRRPQAAGRHGGKRGGRAQVTERVLHILYPKKVLNQTFSHSKYKVPSALTLQLFLQLAVWDNTTATSLTVYCKTYKRKS